MNILVHQGFILLYGIRSLCIGEAISKIENNLWNSTTSMETMLKQMPIFLEETDLKKDLMIDVISSKEIDEILMVHIIVRHIFPK